jgi:hypothetical protein
MSNATNMPALREREHASRARKLILKLSLSLVMIWLAMLCKSRSFFRHLLRSSSQLLPVDRRLLSSAAPATAPAQPLQWTRAASDTIVTSARPLAPSDASHDGIAKV